MGAFLTVAVSRNRRCHESGEPSRCVVGAADKEHEWAKIPGRRRTHDMQAWNRRFEPRRKSRESVDIDHILADFIGQEWITRNVDAIPCPEQRVIHVARASVVQTKPERISRR